MKKTKAQEASTIPNSVIEAANTNLANTEEVKLQMQKFQSISEDPQVLSQTSPLQRAQTLLLLARASSTLVALHLRCNGLHPNDHPVKTELDRLSLYQDKLDRAMASSKAPVRPSTTLNYRAAARFIEHSLPDLTKEQRQNMRDISKGEEGRCREHRNAAKKWKVQSEKSSVRAAAQQFLEKATQELLGANKDDLKGPLRLESSDEED